MHAASPAAAAAGRHQQRHQQCTSCFLGRRKTNTSATWHHINTPCRQPTQLQMHTWVVGICALTQVSATSIIACQGLYVSQAHACWSSTGIRRSRRSVNSGSGGCGCIFMCSIGAGTTVARALAYSARGRWCMLTLWQLVCKVFHEGEHKEATVAAVVLPGDLQVASVCNASGCTSAPEPTTYNQGKLAQG